MRILVLVYNYEYSRIGHYVDHLFRGSSHDVRIVYRKGGNVRDAARFMGAVLDYRPDVLYLFTAGFPTLCAGLLFKLRGGRVVLHYDDFTYQYLRDFSDVDEFTLAAVRLIDHASLGIADYLVVNDVQERYLKQWGWKKRFFELSHGADLGHMRALPLQQFRNQLGLKDVLTVGVVATFNYSRKHDLFYGWELLEALRYLRNEKVRVLFIGTGNAIPLMKARARAYGVASKTMFLGRVPYEELPNYYSILDVCTMTQPDHPSARIKITLKFPEYLACGRFVILSDTAEAVTKYVKDNGYVLPYRGIKDGDYPMRVAQKLRFLARHRNVLSRGAKGRAIAERHFDYRKIAEQLDEFLSSLDQRDEQSGTNLP